MWRIKNWSSTKCSFVKMPKVKLRLSTFVHLIWPILLIIFLNKNWSQFSCRCFVVYVWKASGKRQIIVSYSKQNYSFYILCLLIRCYYLDICYSDNVLVFLWQNSHSNISNRKIGTLLLYVHKQLRVARFEPSLFFQLRY